MIEALLLLLLGLLVILVTVGAPQDMPVRETSLEPPHRRVPPVAGTTDQRIRQ